MPTFEEQLKELEKVVQRLEQGDLTLEENVVLFERGTVLSKDCKTLLAAAESRVQVLLNPEGRGPVQKKDFVFEDGEGRTSGGAREDDDA